MTKETLIKVIVLAVAVGLTELLKIYVFKKDPKYKAIYTFAPVVLCAIGYLIVALVNKEPVWSNITAGAVLGLTSMGSFDAIATILSGWKTKTPTEIAKEISDVIDGKKEIEK